MTANDPIITRSKDRDGALLWILQHQLGRRNLTDIDRVKMGMRLEAAIAAQVKTEQRAKMSAIKIQPERVAVVGAVPSRKTDAKVADLIGMNREKYRTGKRVLENDPSAETRIRAGETTINRE
jgi:hypothetical protein